MVVLTNKMECANYAFEGAFKISGSVRIQDNKVFSLDGSIQNADGSYVGSVNVNQQIMVNVPREVLADATADVLSLLDDIEAEYK